MLEKEKNETAFIRPARSGKDIVASDHDGKHVIHGCREPCTNEGNRTGDLPVQGLDGNHGLGRGRPKNLPGQVLREPRRKRVRVG